MRHQPLASPEEALEHFGVKDIRWGDLTQYEYKFNK